MMEIIIDSFDFITINQLTSKLSEKVRGGELLKFDTMKHEISKRVTSEASEKRNNLDVDAEIANEVLKNKNYLNKMSITINSN